MSILQIVTGVAISLISLIMLVALLIGISYLVIVILPKKGDK